MSAALVLMFTAWLLTDFFRETSEILILVLQSSWSPSGIPMLISSNNPLSNLRRLLISLSKSLYSSRSSVVRLSGEKLSIAWLSFCLIKRNYFSLNRSSVFFQFLLNVPIGC